MTIDGNDIFFAKVKENAIIPSKREEDGGFDLYICSNDDIIVSPFKTVLAPTGIASACSKEFRFQIEERGSTGVKAIKYSAGVIDSGFRNEWFLAIYNGNDNKPILFTNKTQQEVLDTYKPNGVSYGFDVYSEDKYYYLDEVIIYPLTKAVFQDRQSVV